MQQRLVWFCPEFTPYHDALFAAIARDGRFDLRVIIMMGPTLTHPFALDSARPYQWQIADTGSRIDWRLIRTVLNEEPDAWFLIASYYTPTLVATLLAVAQSKRPWLYWTDTPLPQHIQWQGRLPGHRPWWLRLIRRFFLRWIFRHAYRSLATGDAGVTAIRQLGCPKEKSVVFPYWIAMGEKPARLNHPEQRPLRILLGVGQLIYRKGWDIAIRALARARRHHPHLTLWLVGEGEERPLLQQQIAANGLSADVHFLGWKKPEDLPEIFQQADLLIHTARWEPYGVVILEAMAAGLAILGSEASAAAVDRVKPGHSGFIHPVGDEELLSQQILTLANDAALLRTMQEGAWHTAMQWPVERGVCQLAEIIQKKDFDSIRS
ncbi:glycosyltransferase family 4 protein [Candidatus Magnetaquicoccus inordinatus]|uniref:glycosyltransferase family 4 protein n=1 Tax=Candidatus Magnetaquicoccus inordinatus TaxID=2496818 RepID=UPI00102B7010|nr:glycosyltransferase family 4 protein [Candidatus Magnetaquicoccus inordinatus]